MSSIPQPTPESEKIEQTINSIEKYYNIDSHSSIVKMSLSRQLSYKLFGSDRVMMASFFDDHADDSKQDKLHQYFADKYDYEKLCEKFAHYRGTSTMLREILELKISKEPISSHKTRKQLWMLASGARFYMTSNKGTYQKLLAYKDYPDYFSKPIDLDLYRTVLKDKNAQQESIRSMRRLLLCFSRRNPYIGYCQGLNFIAHFILTMQFTEQQGFWLLSQIIESIIPMDYYTNMIGVICDQRILAECIRQHLPKIGKKFNEVGLDPSVFSIEWFVCIFTSSMPFYLVRLLWDRLIIEGMSALIKCGLILLQLFEPQILQATQFPEIILLIEEGARKLNLPENQFNARFDSIYLNKKGLKLARDLYRELYLKEKLAERVVRNKPVNLSEIVCNENWPICTHFLEKAKRDRQEVHVWTMRQKQPPHSIPDYCDRLSGRAKSGKKSSPSRSTSPSQAFQLHNHSSTEAGHIQDNLIIGRMIHVCDCQVSPLRPPTPPPKSKQDHRASLIMETSGTKAMQNLTFLMDTKEEQPVEAKDLLKKLRESQSVDFFKKFVHENKELGDIIANS